MKHPELNTKQIQFAFSVVRELLSKAVNEKIQPPAAQAQYHLSRAFALAKEGGVPVPVLKVFTEVLGMMRSVLAGTFQAEDYFVGERLKWLEWIEPPAKGEDGAD